MHFARIHREIEAAQYLFALDPGKVRAIPLGVNPEYRVLADGVLAAGLERYGLRPRGYLLSVGTIEPRKNLLTTLEAY